MVAADLRRAGTGGVHEVWCAAPVRVARARCAARVRTDSRHPVHVEEEGDERWREWERTAQPLALGAVHRVDTTATVEEPALAGRILAPLRPTVTREP